MQCCIATLKTLNLTEFVCLQVGKENPITPITLKSQQKKHLSEMNGIASLDPWPYIYTIHTKYNCIYSFLWFSEVEFSFTLM